MAGDWIKMRAGLLTHPKVIGMVNHLATDPAFFNFICQDDITGGDLGGFNPDPKSVTDIVTRQALRAVTVCGLLSLWSAARQHSDSGVLTGLTVDDLDEMAGVPGFGRAMHKVGWAVADEHHNSIVLPNFTEWNDQSHKGPTQTNAERQKAFRERQKSRNETVTKSNVEESRGEESRGESKEESARRDEKTFLTGPSEDFDKWWNTYPCRSAKSDAWKAWQAAVVTIASERGIDDAASIAWLLGRTRDYRDSAAGRDPVSGGDFRPAPAKWLSSGKYDDDLKEWAKPNGDAPKGAKTKPKLPPLPQKATAAIQGMMND